MAELNDAYTPEAYVDFTYGDFKSWEYKVKRVSSSKRYIVDNSTGLQTVSKQRANADGTDYYGGVEHSAKFNIKCAFVNITKEQLQEMKVIFNSKTPQKLEFPELRGYWYAIVTNTSTMKYNSRQEGKISYINGEFELQVTCLYPYRVEATQVEVSPYTVSKVNDHIEIIATALANGATISGTGVSYSAKQGDIWSMRNRLITNSSGKVVQTLRLNGTYTFTNWNVATYDRIFSFQEEEEEEV